MGTWAGHTSAGHTWAGIAAGKWAVVALTLATGLGAACAAGDDENPITVGPVGSGGAGPGGSSDCAEQPCKLVVPQCGCAAGERCTLAGDPAVRACVPEGDKTVTQACGECIAGFVCIDNGTGAPAMCHQFCAADTDCADALCVIDFDNGAAKLCSHACDPIAKTGCAEANTKCDLFQEPIGAKWYKLCGAVGAGTQSDPCTVTTDCAAGFGCVPVTVEMATVTLCVEWCDVENPACGAGTCTPFNDP
ncbi:MAG TPA: hypothetical protein VFB62_05890, partial [Polyangiaceae bacterium]|nr:hypothetical protein [Polyangiaceae bacterium]